MPKTQNTDSATDVDVVVSTRVLHVLSSTYIDKIADAHPAYDQNDEASGKGLESAIAVAVPSHGGPHGVEVVALLRRNRTECITKLNTNAYSHTYTHKHRYRRMLR